MIKVSGKQLPYRMWQAGISLAASLLTRLRIPQAMQATYIEKQWNFKLVNLAIIRNKQTLHCTGIAEVVGSNPAQSLKIFSGLCSSSVTAALALMTVITPHVVYINYRLEATQINLIYKYTNKIFNFPSISKSSLWV